MRLLLMNWAIVLCSLVTACSELALTRSPEAEAMDVQKPHIQEPNVQAPNVQAPNEVEPSESMNQPEAFQPEASQPEASHPEASQPETPESGPSAQLIEDLKSILAAQTGIPSYAIMFVSAEAVEWPNSCLGAAKPGEMCAQVITPGYRVVLSTLDKQYELRTDRSGRTVKRKEQE